MYEVEMEKGQEQDIEKNKYKNTLWNEAFYLVPTVSNPNKGVNPLYTIEELKEELAIDLRDEFDDLGFDPDDDINSVRIEYEALEQQIRRMTANELKNYIDERKMILSKIPFPNLTENDFEKENNSNFVDVEKLFGFEKEVAFDEKE